MRNLKEYLRPAYSIIIGPIVGLLLFNIVTKFMSRSTLSVWWILLILFLWSLIHMSPWVNYWSFLYKLNTDHNSLAFKEQLSEDFMHSQEFMGGKVRIGEKYIYSQNWGKVLNKEDVREFGFGKITDKHKNCWEICCVMKSGQKSVIGEYRSSITLENIENWSNEANQYLTEKS